MRAYSTNRALCIAAAFLCLTCQPLAAMEQNVAVSVGGLIGEQPDGAAYTLRLAGRISGPLYEALYVFAEPSHTLLAVLVNPLYSHANIDVFEAEIRGARAVLSHRGGPFAHSLTLPYRPKPSDSRIAVLLKTGGESTLVADAKVNLSRFNFSSAVTLPGSGAKASGGGTTYTHCCSSTQCGTNCATCSSAFFECDLVSCTDVRCID